MREELKENWAWKLGTYIIGGILAFSWIIFTMHSSADAQQFQAVSSRQDRIENKLDDIGNKLDALKTQITALSVLTTRKLP